MQSLVPNFIINPVLRQARRLSSNFATSEPGPGLDRRIAPDAQACHDDGSSETGDDIVSPGSQTRRLSGPPAASTRAFHASETSGVPRRFRTSSLRHGRLTLVDDDDPPATLHSSSPARPTTALSIGLQSSSGERNIPSSLPSSLFGRAELPEDDGMSTLRRRIVAIQSRQISPSEKARLVHDLLMEGYTQFQIGHQIQPQIRPHTPSSPTVFEQPVASGPLDSFKFWQSALGEPSTAQMPVVTEHDLQKTYVPVGGTAGQGLDFEMEGLDETRFLGCEHYRRNVKLQCSTCQRWYTCRLCHNEVEDHALPRRETRNMLCMLCGHAQRASDVCVKCGEPAARYYCSICKLWNGDPDKSIYHCNDCGICRVGEGLGKDFVHCKKCGSCIAITMEESHRCREGAMDCDCPICGEYMFTSHKKVLSMKCGHMIHESCRAEYIKTSYKCPICNKSVENMESQFRRLDKHLEEQPMPPEYQNTRAIILCNDCEAKTSTKYHWGGLKCEVCLSYNTVELQLFNAPAEGRIPERSAVPGNTTAETRGGAALMTPASTTGSIPFSRSLGHRQQASLGSYQGLADTSPVSLPERLARSVSPLPTDAFPEHSFATDESDDEEDMLDFWGRDERRSMTSAEIREEAACEGGGVGEDESDSDECEEPDEDDEDDEEEIALFGHR